MKNKKLTSAMEASQEKWMKHIMFEKEYTQPCAQWMAQRIAALLNHMQYGHALIAYRKQDGTFCLTKATLIHYRQEFGRAYDATQVRSTVVYWNVEVQGWRTFRLENFLEWRPVV